MAEVTGAQKVSRMDWQAMNRGQFSRERFQERADSWITKANQLEQEVAERRSRIDGDDSLSPKGKNDARDQARRELRTMLRPFEEERDNFVQTRDREIAKRVDVLPAGRGEVVQETRAREIRDTLRGKAQGDVVKVYSQAGKRDDLETIKALEDQPMANPVVDPATLDRLKEERLAEKFPEQTDLIKNQTALVELLGAMVVQLGRRIEG